MKILLDRQITREGSLTEFCPLPFFWPLIAKQCVVRSNNRSRNYYSLHKFATHCSSITLRVRPYLLYRISVYAKLLIALYHIYRICIHEVLTLRDPICVHGKIPSKSE